MDRLEVVFWVATIQQTMAGDEDAKARLQSENKLRRQNNEPTIEEELRAMVKK